MVKKHINLCAVRRNAKSISVSTKLITVVKANAYGHGAIAVAKALERIAFAFAVATENEAKDLLESGIQNDIIILQPCRYPGLNANNIIYTLSSPERAVAFEDKRVALKFNTGMNRFGADKETVKPLIKEAGKYARIHSVYTHLRDACCASETDAQYALFDNFTDKLPYLRHIAASGAIERERKKPYGAARCGIALYGGITGFESAMKVTANIIETRHVKRGEGVGYGSATITEDTDIAVIDIGYRNGYRRLSAPRYVSIKGIKRKVLAVCMDCSITECGSSDKATDEVEIMGESITPHELALSFGTNEYELFTTIGINGEYDYGY